MVTLRREYSSDLRQLAAMRALVRDACRRAWGAASDDEAVGLLELALDEAATNVILHAYQGQEGRPIELVVEADADRACVALYHHGRDFDPCAAPPPDFSGARESGFGLYLMQQSVDEVRYQRDEN